LSNLLDNDTISELMKKEIHPEYHPKAKIHCACGNTFTFGATKPEIQIDICSKCHPFYTGKEKVIDTAGRIEKFKARQIKAASGRGDKKMRGSLHHPQKGANVKKAPKEAL
jgi:large subunit ribosomal protein L31